MWNGFIIAGVKFNLLFSGEFVAGGMHLDQTTVKKNTATDGLSTAFYFQRLRLNTTFIVHPGLTLLY